MVGQFKEERPTRLGAEDLKEIDSWGSPQLSALARWANEQLTCSHCRQCTWECEVLKTPGIDVGVIEREYDRIMALPEANRNDAVIKLVTDWPDLFVALRRCCFCGQCTAACQHHVLAPDRMRAWRELFANAGYIPEEKLVMVDNEWDIFSAYRAVYGIAFDEFASLDYAATVPGTYDTLLFPGCSLASYAPEVTRAVCNWMNRAGFHWAMSTSCCGSPLMSAGRFDRAQALREGLLDKIKQAGITRVITVCPGCGEELAVTMAQDVDILPLPEVLLQESARMEREGIDPGFHPLDRASLTFFDSCHDRHDNRHANAIRALMAKYLPQAKQLEMAHNRKNSLCCGAGGAVGGYDPAITDRRVWRVIDEARDTGAQNCVTMCPTCTYTIAQACLNADADRGIENHHYLELLLGVTIDWPQVFQQLNDMWTGEYGPWLNQTFFS